MPTLRPVAKPGLDETSTSFRYRVRDPDEFTVLRTLRITTGVQAVVGKTSADAPMRVQTLIFSKTVFPTADAVRTWLRDHPDILKSTRSPYRIIHRSAGDELRYTLGVAYPANRPDSYNDYMTEDELQRAAWNFMRGDRRIGLMHWPGTDRAGTVVESYIWRGPEYRFGTETVRPGDWMLGVIWEPEAWRQITAGQLVGYSFQGFAHLIEEDDTSAA